jgi:hypothetical protein
MLMSSSIQSLSCAKRKKKEEEGENRNETPDHASQPYRPQLGHAYLRASECPLFHLGVKHMVVGHY